MRIVKNIKYMVRVCNAYVTVYRVGPVLAVGGSITALVGFGLTWRAVGRFYPGRRDFAREMFAFCKGPRPSERVE